MKKATRHSLVAYLVLASGDGGGTVARQGRRQVDARQYPERLPAASNHALVHDGVEFLDKPPEDDEGHVSALRIGPMETIASFEEVHRGQEILRHDECEQMLGLTHTTKRDGTFLGLLKKTGHIIHVLLSPVKLPLNGEKRTKSVITF